MKILFRIILIIVVIIALALIAALFIKKEYAIEREITINTPADTVFNYIKFLKNQDYYSKWVMMDPAMKKSFRGTDGTTGFVYAWDGNKKAGKGEQEIKNIDEGKRLDIEIRFEKPFAGVANTYMTTEPVAGNQTKVKWRMEGKSNYPMNFMNLFMDKMLGKDIETSLGNLKTLLEK